MPPASTRPLGAGLDLALYVALPLAGLFLWGWDWRPIVLLYWLENITIGGLTLISLVRQRRAGESAGAMPPLFFAAHYGIFTLVHGVFVIVIITIVPLIFGASVEPFPPLLVVGAWALASAVQWVLAMRATPPKVFGVGRAYARIVALHVTILGGVWLIVAFNLPSMVAVGLIVLHAITDLVMARGSRGSWARGRWEVTRPSGASWNARWVRNSDD